MAERIVSPGVFTSEKDLSFLPQGVADIGAAIIGPTTKGPAFTPTVLNNYSEFEEMFGGLDRRFYTPYTVQQYLRSAGTVTVVRVLGLGGYKPDIIISSKHNSAGPIPSYVKFVSNPSPEGITSPLKLKPITIPRLLVLTVNPFSSASPP